MIWTLTHILFIAVILAGFLSFSLLLGLLAALRKSCRSGEDAGPYLDAGYTVQKGSMPIPHPSDPSHPSAPTTRICSNCHQSMIHDAEASYPDICPACLQRWRTELRLANDQIETHL